MSRRHDPSVDREGIIGTRFAPALGLDDLPLFADQPKARITDPDTSHAAAAAVKSKAATRSARLRLLEQYQRMGITGLTDREAAELAELPLDSEYATRCSELRKAGLIEMTPASRRAPSGALRKVSRITAKGRYALQEGQL